MRIEDLTSDIDRLERMSDQELEAYFAPVLNVTRPELAAKAPPAKSPNGKPSRKPAPSYDINKCRELARNLGLKLDI